MTLALTLNGTTTTTIPGSPSSGDRIAMSNGTIRFSFVYGVHTAGHWYADLAEWSPDGTTWTTALYWRDDHRPVVKGAESPTANAALSILTNTVSTLQLQLQSSVVVNTVTYTCTTTWTMTTAQPNLECSQYVAASAQVSLTSGQYIEDWGPSYISTGLTTSCLALYQGYVTTYDANRTKPILYTGNLTCTRPFIKNSNQERGYNSGYVLYHANGLMSTFVASPVSHHNLIVNIIDPNTTLPQGGLNGEYNFRGFATWYPGLDGAYQAQHDKTPTFLRMATSFGNGGAATTFPQATTATDATTTLNLTWSLCIEKPTTGGGSGTLPVPRWMFPQSINKWMDTLYARPTVGGSGISGGGSGPMWQTLATQEATVLPVLAATYATNFEAIYGYNQNFGTAAARESYVSALALRCCLRWSNLGVGNADALTMSDKLAVVLANFQTQSGAQTGAFQIFRTIATSAFTCEQSNHIASGDQPHVVMYAMAECVYALIDYYRVRGNQTLAATYGNITVSALLDAAMVYLVNVQQTDGGWLVETNASGTATSTNPNTGASWAGGSTPDLAASLLQWSALSPTATATQKTSWQKAATRAANYWIYSESVPHGGYEAGETYVLYSAHALECALRGLLRLHRLTGSNIYLEYGIYYFEVGILMCKRFDDVINNSATNSKDMHTGGLIATIDNYGVITGEAGSIWAIMLTDALIYHPQLLAVHYFYLYAALAHQTWGYRDTATYTASSPNAQAYMSPGTNYCGFSTGLDNTRFMKHAPCAALHLLPTRTLVACDNANVLSTCLEANLAADTPAGRTILLYNPQGTPQTINLTVKGQAGKSVTQDGTPIVSTANGTDMLLAFTLSSGQISKITTR